MLCYMCQIDRDIWRLLNDVDAIYLWDSENPCSLSSVCFTLVWSGINQPHLTIEILS